jgi:tyrosinase
MTAQKYISPEISLAALSPAFSRADIIFHEVDHAGASFEAALFLNNADADETTDRTPAHGFAGCFHIFGHGGCSGGAGHCEVTQPPRPYDPRRAHPLTPTRKVVIATDALRQVVGQTATVRVTVIATVTGGTERCDLENMLQFERISIETYG